MKTVALGKFPVLVKNIPFLFIDLSSVGENSVGTKQTRCQKHRYETSVQMSSGAVDGTGRTDGKQMRWK